MPAKETATLCVKEKACEQLQSMCQKLLLQLMGVGFFFMYVYTPSYAFIYILFVICLRIYQWP